MEGREPLSVRAGVQVCLPHAAACSSVLLLGVGTCDAVPGMQDEHVTIPAIRCLQWSLLILKGLESFRYITSRTTVCQFIFRSL